MNVLFLSEILYPHGGGAELATYLYAKLLSQAGIDVRVVTNSFSGKKKRSKFGNLEIVSLPLLRNTTSLKFEMLSNLALITSSFLRQCISWADVVYVPLYWYSAIPQAKLQRRPVIVHLHNYILTCPLGTLFRLSSNSVCKGVQGLICPASCIFEHEKAGNRLWPQTALSTLLNSVGKGLMEVLALKSDALICVSKAQKEVIAKTTKKVLQNRLHVAYNPLPELPYIDIEDNGFGYFGGNSASKGIAVLYKAARILGLSDEGGTKIYATKFQKVAHATQSILESAGFTFFGKLNEYDYNRLYQRFHCVVVPSVWQEPLPYVVSESLLRGRFVIASNIGGIPEITAGCKGVELFDAGNYQQLANKMEYASSLSREEVRELGIKNRKCIMKKFNDKVVLDQFIEILEKVK